MTSELSPDRLLELDGFLVELNLAAAEAILPLFRTACETLNKAGEGAYDPVTAADRAGEAAIRRLIAERYPHHGVVGEEYGEDRPGAELVWVIDPIDGTRAFVAGLPVWTTLIGLKVEGRPRLGSIAQPYIGELFIGSAAGARLERAGVSAPLKTALCASLAEARIATTDADLFAPQRREGWRALRAACRVARFGCDAYAYAMVALGQLDLVVEEGLSPWDLQPALPVIAGAGGLVTDWRGAPVTHHSGQVIIAGDPRCLAAAVEVMTPFAA